MNKAYYYFKAGKKSAEGNNFIQAIMYLEKAKKEEPEKSSIRETLARSYYNCGLYASARDNFQKVLDIDASNDFAYYGLGLSLAKLGRIEQARGKLKIALTMKPACREYEKALKNFIP